MSTKVVISEPLRTAIGTFGGTLQDTSAVELGVTVVKEILSRTGVDPTQIDEVITGNILGAGQGQNPSRQVALGSGLDNDTPAYSLNRVCASGVQSVANAAQAIKAGDAGVVLAGGIENMNLAPFIMPKARYGYRMALEAKDTVLDGMVYDGLWDIFNNYHMGMTAENLAEKYNISREEQDKFAIESQGKAKKAQRAGTFKKEIVPVQLKKGVFDIDEHPREVSMAALSRLKPVFTPEGSVTAGNASGINDGAAYMIVSSDEKAKELGLDPIGEVISYAVAGVEPSIMGIGPVPAMTKALAKAGLTIDDIDLVELNEAFAVQSLAVLSDFPIPAEKLNVNGGAVALGHPIGASGTVLIVKLLHEMQRRKVKRGLVSLCVGGGMGIAMVIENPKA
ncbi:acetyl-CoA C-acetyltransferase [bacterium]|jgi:acetyl-CoA C-acetyltransferase|nr:acetyl-CoA C-acetyltransferase [bacterium]MBT3850727.1 acetyl-CoA C-acetyltransferase [bacterium]MDG2445451.1 acetyl-CoA C-acetyltransferase [Thermodesulfobacteriota bacterium]|tara:strand:- start:5021 stop:6202 length:1182 start_codon:yes stop_codon:yes gene_type:complete